MAFNDSTSYATMDHPTNSSNSSLDNETIPFDMPCQSAQHSDYSVMLSIRVFFGASLLFVVIGLVGNGLSMAVFSSKEMRAVSSNVYLLALAASDSLFLILIFITKLMTTMRCWYFPEARIDVANHFSLACVMTQYLSDLFSDYSTCLILLFTVERSVAVFIPMRYKELCTVQRARLACGALFLVLGISIAPYHFILIELHHAYRFCGILVQHEHLFVTMYTVELILFRVTPVFVIAILNAFIIVRITKLTRAKNKRRAASKLLLGASKGGNGCGAPGCGNGGGGGGGGASGAVSHHRSSAAKNEDRNLQLTIILILVSTSYILLYIPVLLDFSARSLMSQATMDAARETLMIVGNYTKTLYICGFAINFFLYTVSGRVFRDQLNGILCSGARTGGERGEMSVGAKTQATNAPEASEAV